MTELPDDLAQWPDDPFRILGLPRRSSASDAKRAYTKLLRRFKPEKMPDHFQRLREAYESVQTMLEYASRFGDDEEEGTITLTFAPPREAASEDFGETNAEAEKIVSPGAAAWEKALTGDHRGAYAELLRAVEYDGGEIPEQRGADYARLYWLETLYPELAPQAAPIRWVTLGLMRVRYHEALLELLRREAERNPQCVLQEELAQFLQRVDSRTSIPLVLMRFQAAAELDREDSIRDDYLRLRRTLALESPRAWEYVTEEAVRHALRTSTFNEPHWNEVRDSLERSEFGGDYRWERLEWMSLARTATRHRPPGCDHWLNLLRLSFVPSGREFEAALKTCVHRLALTPLAALDFLDALEQREPPAAAWLLQTLEGYAQRRNPRMAARSRNSEPIVPLVWRNFALQQYDTYRRELLKFSLYEMMPPPEAFQFLATRCNILPTDRLGEDRILLTIAAVYFAFWSPPGETSEEREE